MKRVIAGLLGLCAVAIGTQAQAVVINFDDLTGPSTFAETGGVTRHLDILTSVGSVSIDGGVVLTKATNLPADQTSVYGTASFAGQLQNPITFIFGRPVTNFVVDLFNGLTADIGYQLSDDQNHVATFTLAPNAGGGNATIGF